MVRHPILNICGILRSTYFIRTWNTPYFSCAFSIECVATCSEKAPDIHVGGKSSGCSPTYSELCVLSIQFLYLGFYPCRYQQSGQPPHFCTVLLLLKDVKTFPSQAWQFYQYAFRLVVYIRHRYNGCEIGEFTDRSISPSLSSEPSRILSLRVHRGNNDIYMRRISYMQWTPEHIRDIVRLISPRPPRRVPDMFRLLYQSTIRLHNLSPSYSVVDAHDPDNTPCHHDRRDPPLRSLHDPFSNATIGAESLLDRRRSR